MAETTVTYPPLTAAEFNVGADERTAIPLVEGDGESHVIAFGHVGKAAMAAAVNAYDIEVCGVDPEDVTYTASDIEHVYAVTERPADDPEGWWIRWGSPEGGPVTADTPHAFAVTVVSR